MTEQARISQLKAQYPVIEECLRLGNWYWDQDLAKDQISIEIREADANLLMYQPRLIDEDRMTQGDPAHKGMLGTGHE